MIVVIDTNVFLSAAVSLTGSARRCFGLAARRQIGMAVTNDILTEYETTAERVARRLGKYHDLKWQPLFNWVQDKATYFEPSPLGKQRSRDVKDDIFLACALASGAKIIVSYDEDLLKLQKPFGIEILKPSVFVARLK